MFMNSTVWQVYIKWHNSTKTNINVHFYSVTTLIYTFLFITLLLIFMILFYSSAYPTWPLYQITCFIPVMTSHSLRNSRGIASIVACRQTQRVRFDKNSSFIIFNSGTAIVVMRTRHLKLCWNGKTSLAVVVCRMLINCICFKVGPPYD